MKVEPAQQQRPEWNYHVPNISSQEIKRRSDLLAFRRQNCQTQTQALKVSNAIGQLLRDMERQEYELDKNQLCNRIAFIISPNDRILCKTHCDDLIRLLRTFSQVNYCERNVRLYQYYGRASEYSAQVDFTSEELIYLRSLSATLGIGRFGQDTPQLVYQTIVQMNLKIPSVSDGIGTTLSQRYFKMQLRLLSQSFFGAAATADNDRDLADLLAIKFRGVRTDEICEELRMRKWRSAGDNDSIMPLSQIVLRTAFSRAKVGPVLVFLAQFQHYSAAIAHLNVLEYLRVKGAGKM